MLKKIALTLNQPKLLNFPHRDSKICITGGIGVAAGAGVGVGLGALLFSYPGGTGGGGAGLWFGRRRKREASHEDDMLEQ